MKRGKKEITAPIWFDQWCRQADVRQARRRRVADLLDSIGAILIVTGLLFVIVGTMWIDSMDICKGNILLSFAGVGLAWAGVWLKWRRYDFI